MTSTRSTKSVAVTLLLCALLVLGGVPAGAAEESQKGADDYLSTLRTYEDAAALEAYSEFEVIRSQAVTAVQVGEFTAAERRKMNATVSVLQSFVAAYEAAQNDSRIESLALADETAAAIDSLEAADGEQYATLAQLGLERFYRQQGDALYERSRSTTNTSTRLRYLDAASRALKRGGASDRYSRVSAEASMVRATFEADSERIRTALSAASTFERRCGNACASPVTAVTTLGPGIFDRYQDARAASSAAAVADRLVEKHGLTKYQARTDSLASRTSQMLFSLAVGATLLLFGYAAIVGVIAAAIAVRVGSWAEDVEGSKVGRIVPTESVEVSNQ